MLEADWINAAERRIGSTLCRSLMFVLIVRMAMMVGMGVHDAPVHMSMCVGEVGSKKQALIREDLCWLDWVES